MCFFIDLFLSNLWGFCAVISSVIDGRLGGFDIGLELIEKPEKSVAKKRNFLWTVELLEFPIFGGKTPITANPLFLGIRL